MTFIVTEKAMRPASTRRKCFYCHSDIGAVHDSTCVLVRRRVRVRLAVPGYEPLVYSIVVPASWTVKDIEFHRNESSWCANNAIRELKSIDPEFSESLYLKYARDRDPNADCLCSDANFEYVEDVAGPDGEPYLDE